MTDRTDSLLDLEPQWMLERANRVQVEYLDDATLPRIGEMLRRFQPHVFHDTGHGVYDKVQAAIILALEREDGRTHWASLNDLGSYLAQVFYSALANGDSLAQAMQRVRLAWRLVGNGGRGASFSRWRSAGQI